MTLDFTSTDWGFPSSYVTTEASYTNNGYTITFGKGSKGHKAMTSGSGTNKKQTGIIFGAKDATLSLPAFDFDVEQIVVVGNENASANVGQNIYVGDTEVSTVTTGAKGTNTYKIASDYQAAGNIYTLKVTTSHNTQITKIEIYKKGDVPVTVSAPTFSPEGYEFSTPFTLTLATETEGASIYYTTDGTEPTTSSTLYEDGISISATTTVKAIAAIGDAVSEVSTATYTYKEIVVPQGSYVYTKVTSTDDLVAGERYLIVNETNSKAMGKQNTSSYRNSADVTVSGGVITLDASQVATTEGDEKVYEFVLGGEEGQWYWQDPLDGKYLYCSASSELIENENLSTNTYATITFSSYGNVDITYTNSKGNSYVIRYKKDSNRFNAWASDGLAVQLYRKQATKTGTITITDAGYATFYTEDAYLMPEGVTGATITTNDDASLTIHYNYPAGETVPSKSPLLLKGDPGQYTYTIVESDKEADTNTVLHGSTEDVTTSVEGMTYYYKLSYDDNGENLGFYWGAEDGGAFTSKGGLCYLALPASIKETRQGGFAFSDLGTTTGIGSTTTAKTGDATIYTLDGRRVQRIAAPGLYIVGGKKCIVK